jgi:ApaG protein
MYSAKTNGIKVSAVPVYIDEQSVPAKNFFVWAYQIVIENQTDRIVQLVSRYWNITDAMGTVQEVRGPGVVGEQPVIRPNQHYEYTSGTQLKTSSGIMTGKYYMQFVDSGEEFEVDIPAFSLDTPYNDIVIN